MSENDPRPLVLAVGHDDMEPALTYAAEEAARAACDIHLVHVVHPLALGPESPLVDAVDLEQAGRLALDGAAERLRDLLPDGPDVTQEVLTGAVVPRIVAAAAAVHAREIVLQRRALPRVARIVLRSVSSGVAAHARIPVVSVPETWSSSPAGGDPAPVTAGIDVPERSDEVIRAALAAARGRHAPLDLLHTWSFPGVYDDIIMSRTEHEDWADVAAGAIGDAVVRLGAAAAGVDVRIEGRHAFAADALVEASRRSSLVVVGRHDSAVPLGSHLGPVARAVLHHAACPVLLVDPKRHGLRSGTERPAAS